MAMGQHVAGRVRKMRLHPPDALLALFEAVANSIDAIETSSIGSSLCIRVVRDTSQPVMGTGKEKVGRHPLLGFEVRDDGPGFDDGNFNCFRMADLTQKAALGAKGEGRFAWLRVFDGCEIDSVYEHKEKRFRRQFHFSLSEDGVGKQSQSETTLPRGTTVRLLKPLAGYDKVLDKEPERLARALLDHYAVYFLSDPNVAVRLVDESASYDENLNKTFESETDQHHTAEPFQLGGLNFVAHHFTKPKSPGKNTLSLCAAKRSVVEIDLTKLSVDLGEPIYGLDGQRLSYRVAVTGAYLDEIVDHERTGLRFLSENSIPTPGEITRKQLLDAVKQCAETYQRDHLQRVRAEKEKRVERIVAEQCPHLRPFLGDAKSRIDNLPMKASERQIEMAIYEAKVDAREEMSRLVQELVSTSPVQQQVEKHSTRIISRFVNEANRHNQSALAEYVCTREAVLAVLEANLGTDKNNEHEYESVIHDLFFPRGHTSASVPTGASGGEWRRIDNLWIIDERLVFHQLLASDMPLDKLRGFLSDSQDEADVVVFEPAFVANDPDDFQTITIVEFKRPGRDEYGDGPKKNPIQQLIALAKRLRDGEFQDVAGRRRRLATGAMIYGYAICDITDRLKELLDTSLDMTLAADGESYYYYHKTAGMFIEVISYEKLIRNAKRRNAGFFRELGGTTKMRRDP